MDRKYNPHQIEEKWRASWKQERESFIPDTGKEQAYVLDMISYPSGEGLHMGHWRPYTIADVWARYQTMQGKQVLSPVGFDSFGLPAENAAIKTQTPPQVYTERAITNFTRQLKETGKMYDWSTAIATSSPEYYQWTQWLFLQLYKHELAYRKQSPVWWCPSCQTVLANEQVINGECERCGTTVVKKDLKQWFLKITVFADELLNFEGLNWPERVKHAQTNWIGKSEGAMIRFQVNKFEPDTFINVFTTRADTLYGVTYLVVAPEHELVATLTTHDQQSAVQAYIAESKTKTEIDRLAEDRPKTGVFTGSYAVHPFTNEELPIWVADYVLASYGTGAVMAVPAHDQRDYDFAKSFDLPIKAVIAPETGTPQDHPEFRRSIVALVRNPKTNEVLTINWGDKGGHLFVGGGLESGEDSVACAKREIEEETGYTNLRFIEQIGPIHHNYFAISKGKARRIEAYGLLFELIDDTQIQTHYEVDEQDQFTVTWLPESNVGHEIKDELHGLVYKTLVLGQAYTGNGIIINSGEYNGLPNQQAGQAILNALQDKGLGSVSTTYRLRDWLVSRQRYWGAPIPIIYCDSCGEVPVPEADLPVRLPEDAEFIPTGGSPLERHPSFKHVDCPQCGKPATRETDTLDTFVDSSWYYLRFTDPKNTDYAFTSERIKTWLPVDFYVGGVEHSILHLLYARFIMKALHRLDLVPYNEPFQTFLGNGMVYLYGKKMSKSKGNIVNPDDMVKKYGTDPLRGYILFMGPADQDVEWQDNGITGVVRFLHKAWDLFAKVNHSSSETTINPVIHQSVTEITQLLDSFNFNRSISTLMIAINKLEKTKLNPHEAGILTQLFGPFFPHFAEEVWHNLSQTTSVFDSQWPVLPPFEATEVTYIIQINGKMRSTLTLDRKASEEEVVRQAKENITLQDKTITRVVFVPGRLVNFVVQ